MCQDDLQMNKQHEGESVPLSGLVTIIILPATKITPNLSTFEIDIVSYESIPSCVIVVHV